MSKLCSIARLLGSGAVLLAMAAGAEAGTVTYKASKADFANPERGFYIADGYDPDQGWTDPLDLDRLRDARAKGMSLVHMYYVLGAYRTGPIAEGLIERVRDDLATARAAGVKVILRFSYNFGPIGAADASQAQILSHIEQLGPALAADADVIAIMEAGFIGTWGEWHSSTNGLDNDASWRAVLTKLLDVLPEDRAVVVRTPRYKQGIFGTKAALTAAEGFGGSDRARTGAHNDCFLASVDDWGTYSSTKKAVIEAEKSYLGQDNLFVPQTGETCNADKEAKPYIACKNALRDLARMRWSALNSDYHPAVLKRWRNEGCFSEIQRSLGYRFVLSKAEVPATAAAGGTLTVSLTVANQGWAAPYNPRPVELVLRNKATGARTALATGVDARSWSPGSTRTVSLSATVPSNMVGGSYQLLLSLPDPTPSLRARAEYAIRVANDGLWDAATGLNDLKAAIAVTGG